MKHKRFFLVILFFLFYYIHLASQDYNYITDIVVTGNINVSSKLIQSASGLALGDIYSSENIANAIRYIYNLGLFANIDINKLTDEKGVKIIIKVTELPIIQSIIITGNENIKKEDINSEIFLIKGDYLSGEKKFEIRNRILTLYYEKGYRFASVKFIEKPLKENKIELTISINEGLKITVKDITFSGNSHISSKKLRSEMKTKASSFFRSGGFKLDKFEEDLQRIVEFYHSKGFIDASIVDWVSEYDEQGNLFIEIKIFEGNQYKLGSVLVKGNSRFSDKAIISQLKIKKGEIFNQEEFNDKLNTIYSMYIEEGYLYSIINKDIQTKGEHINIVIEITENTRARVRQIFIEGNKKTREKIIRRQLAIVPGDYIRQSLLFQSQRNIYNLGFFEPNIGLDYQPINAEGDIDLTFTVEDKESGAANLGVNFDQQDKLVGFIALSHNNLFGKAWGIKLQWEFSGVKQNYDISFTNPYFLDTNTLVGFDVYHTKRNWTDWNYRVYRTGGGFRIGTIIPWINYSRITSGYAITQKKYEIIEPTGDTSQNVQDLVDTGKKIISNMFVTLERDSRDNIFRPTAGCLVRSFTELAGGPLGGKENYYKEIMQTNWYIKLFWKVAFGMKWRIGYVKEFGQTSNVPPDERFYPGGTGPDGIRGYPDRSVIPPSSDGGRAELITSSEVTIPISTDQIIGVLFFDAGNSYNYFSELNVQGLKKGSGIGIRIMSPMGLLGFDYAYGFDREEKNKWQFHFQFGSTF
ncbi:MAG: outer membrane protein assembly factor BamA [Candidatus Cloacimonetes bacterium]|nr:outer membrane protein assembly factor BamA [Candidatus Cloacimonadota bacterium]MBL7085768.1 outer membrane protein assembly factor BamA [Candidatus Cloacimonadota bacterium]